MRATDFPHQISSQMDAFRTRIEIWSFLVKDFPIPKNFFGLQNHKNALFSTHMYKNALKTSALKIELLYDSRRGANITTKEFHAARQLL
jgi:hypothetical protein